MANTLVNTLDLPFWELLNQAPASSGALAALTTSEDGLDRFIYYVSSSTLYRYDTHKDTWQQLATTPSAPVTVVAMRHTKRRGFHGRVISATSSTVTIGGLRGKNLSGETLSIESGTGVGQERTLTLVSENILESGVVTGTNTTALADTTKKWRINEWAGYTVGINFGTGTTLYRRILYSDTNTLYISDLNLIQQDPWGTTPFLATAPYALPVSTAGSQAHYTISSQTFSLNSNWTTTPDTTSFFTTRTGGLYLVTSNAVAPFFNLYYYDIANDLWAQKSTPQNFLFAALGTDVTLSNTGKITAPYVTKVGTVSATSRTLADDGLTLTADRYANHMITITGGTGIGQKRRIVAHTATAFSVTPVWDTTPDSTSTYEVTPNLDKLWMIPGGLGSMFQYDAVTDNWSAAEFFDQGVANNISVTINGFAPLGVSSITRIASGVTAVTSTPVVAGTGYSIGDILTLTTGGGGAQVIVNSVASNGAILSVSLLNSGTSTGYTVVTSATTGGTGTSATIGIASVGPTANVVTVTNHFIKPGQTVTIRGCATDTSYNASFTVIGPFSITGFSISAPSSTTNPTAAASQGVSTLVDSTKAWATNEHVGRIVNISAGGSFSPTNLIAWITANTATTLTLATSITAPSNGSSKYWISDAKVFGAESLYEHEGKGNSGWATGGSTTTLVDSTKSWIPGQWVGYLFKVEAGTGYGSGRIAVTANSATTLTFATQSFTPDATTKYEIADTWGLITTGTSTSVFSDSAHAWTVNQFAGKRLRITSGASGNINTAYDLTVLSNTATTLTLSSALPSTPTSGQQSYSITAIAPRGAGSGLMWNWGVTDSDVKGRYFYSVRGGATGQIDVYDIPTGKWTLAPHIRGLSELWTTGSTYAYGGKNTFYLTRTANGAVVRVFAYDLNKQEIRGLGTTTMLTQTVTTGNIMESVSDANGNEFIYILQGSGANFTRALIW